MHVVRQQFSEAAANTDTGEEISVSTRSLLSCVVSPLRMVEGQSHVFLESKRSRANAPLDFPFERGKLPCVTHRCLVLVLNSVFKTARFLLGRGLPIFP